VGTGAVPGHDGGVELVPVGQACLDTTVEIHEPETGAPLGPGAVGEIWVQGPAVSAGYWRAPELSAQVLVDDDQGRRWLRTGDLGALVDGDLYITGRAKDMIVLRGTNHYPQDIEITAERASSLLRPGSGAAFSVDTDGQERLIIAYEARPGAGAGELAGAAETVAAAVTAEHGVAVDRLLLLAPGTIPKTSSGKIQRGATRARHLSGDLGALAVFPPLDADTATAAPADNATGDIADAATGENKLVYRLRERLAALVEIAPARINPERPLVGYGVDSLTAVEFAHVLQREWGYDVPAAALLDGGSLRELADALSARPAQSPHGAIAASAASAEPAESTATPADPEAEYPAGLGQRSMWFLDQLGESARYHVCWAARYSQRFDEAALRAAFDHLVGRHPALRTGFSERGDGLWAVPVSRTADFAVVDAAELADTVLADLVSGTAHAPFDLAAGRVFRARVFRHDGGDVLLVAAHHVAVDFWSLASMLGELRAHYTGQSAPQRVPAGYAEHVRAEQRYLTGPDSDADAGYWRSVVARPVPALGLPAGTGGRPQGAMLPFTLPAELTEQVREAANAAVVTPFVLLAAAYGLLLAERTGDRDVTLAAPTAGRQAARDRDVVGYFVNTVLLRTEVPADGAVLAYVRQVRDVVLAALRHDRYPFARLAETVPAGPDGTAQLARTMIVFEGVRPGAEPIPPGLALGLPGATARFADGTLDAFPLRAAPPPFDLVLVLAESADEIAGSWHVAADAVASDAVAQFTPRYTALLTTIVGALCASAQA
jgi:aryl carrier-like protein